MLYLIVALIMGALFVAYKLATRTTATTPAHPDLPGLADVMTLAKRERGPLGLRWLRRQWILHTAGVPVMDVLIPENWPKLLEPGLRMIWHTRMKSREAIMKASQIFNPEASQRAFEEFQGIGEVGSDGWNEFEKYRKVPYGGFEPNFLQRLRHRTYAKGLIVERELLEDNLYPQAGIPSQINQQVVKLADSAALFREKAAADVFNNAFTDAGLSASGHSVAGPDGVGLVSTVHPFSPTNTQQTQSNEFTLALTGPNLSTVRQAMLNWVDDKGDPTAMEPDTLLVPVGLGDLARTLTETEFVLGSNNNDRNPHYKRFKVVEWKFLTNSDAWFLIDSTLMSEHLHWIDRVKPEWQSNEDFDGILAKYRGYMRFSVGWSTWQWIAGSDPTP